MTTLPTLTPFLNELHKSSRLRVWSIVVTIFGDLVQPRGTPISTQELLQLTEAIGVEGNALRTAMSRLAKEGWVTRHKQGRTSAYSLSQSGANTFLAASERIYNPNFFSTSNHWHLAVCKEPIDPTTIDHATSFLINKTTCLSQDLTARKDCLAIKATIEDMPNWLKDQLIPQTLCDNYKTLHDLLRSIGVTQAKSLTPLEAMALRFITVHFWRRLVLRHPLLPAHLVDADWVGNKTHRRVKQLYAEIIEPSEKWWETPTTNKGLAQLQHRFQ
ncbi:MAG: PaaX family transcriptional regulator C-terminal domain-containing protein [Hyphomicrobiales bacterium]